MSKMIFVLVFGSLSPIQAQRSSEDIAKTFFSGLASKDAAIIGELIPSPDDFKRISPLEIGNQTDEQIVEIVERMKLTLVEKFQQIVNEGMERGMNLSDLKIAEVSEEEIDLLEEGGAIRFMVGIKISYSYKGKEGKFSLMSIPYKGNLYLLDIPRSYNVFAQLFED